MLKQHVADLIYRAWVHKNIRLTRNESTYNAELTNPNWYFRKSLYDKTNSNLNKNRSNWFFSVDSCCLYVYIWKYLLSASLTDFASVNNKDCVKDQWWFICLLFCVYEANIVNMSPSALLMKADCRRADLHGPAYDWIVTIYYALNTLISNGTGKLCHNLLIQ